MVHYAGGLASDPRHVRRGRGPRIHFHETLFVDTMRVIKETRNELFHSNPIKDRKKIVEACERILNGLQFHLGDYDHDLGAAQYVRVPTTVARTPRHVMPAR